MLRPCEVQARHRQFWGRVSDALKFGHCRHVCAFDRPFAQEHPGGHACACGFGWPHSSTDNGPALW